MADDLTNLTKLKDCFAASSDEERHAFMMFLKTEHQATLLTACQYFSQCGGCGKIVHNVTKTTINGSDEWYCDDCMATCICGERYSPFESDLHDDCNRSITRCYCGKLIELATPNRGRCPYQTKCTLEAKVNLKFHGDFTADQQSVLGSFLAGWEMIQVGDGWVSTKTYPIDATFSLSQANTTYTLSIFGGLGPLKRIEQVPLELAGLNIEFTDANGMIDTLNDPDMDDKFQVPDPDMEQGYTKAEFFMVMKLVDRPAKRAKSQ